MKTLLVLLALCLAFHGIPAAIWDFDWDFTGYSKKTAIFIDNCDANMTVLVNLALANRSTTQCIEFPTVNLNLPHVDCIEDKVMGPSMQFTMYISDDEVGGAIDRQRLEMKVFNPSPEDLKSRNNSNYIYAWWFKLNPDLKAPSDFFHTFQLKAVGKPNLTVDSFPIFTFTVNDTNGFHFRIRRDDHKNGTMEENFDFFQMISLHESLGQWIQAFVEAQYGVGNDASSTNPGYVKVMLKDINGRVIWPQNPEDGLVYNDMFWPEADFVRPKWGLYRRLDDGHNPIDWQLFQNVQIWKKNQ